MYFEKERIIIITHNEETIIWLILEPSYWYFVISYRIRNIGDSFSKETFIKVKYILCDDTLACIKRIMWVDRSDKNWKM